MPRPPPIKQLPMHHIFVSCDRYERDPSAPAVYVEQAARSSLREVAGAGACSQRSSCRTSCTAGSPAAEATVSRRSSSKKPARALCAATAMMLLQRDTQAARIADRTAACPRSACARARSLRKVVGSEPQRHQPRQRTQKGGSTASAQARGRCRDAYASLLAGARGRADCQLLAAARRSE